jgi:HK97 family phage major capsid protein
MPLLAAGQDPTRPTQRTIAGVPLYVSLAITDDVVWGIDRSRTFLAMRADTTLDIDASRYFESDRIGLRATMRCGYAFAHPAAIIRIEPTP